MNLTNSQRVLKLFGNLLVNPGLIGPYVKHNILTKKMPIEWNLPWWSYKAIQYVDTIVDGKRIFEYGTGGSTVRFASKAKEIIAVEDDDKWMNLVNAKLQEQSLSNARIVHSFFDFKNSVDFERSDYIKMIDKVGGDFDIVIIDGQDGTFQERIKCFRHVEPKMRPGSYIIVDDFWRYEILRKENRAKSVEVFESVGPCRYGVTSTAVFSY